MYNMRCVGRAFDLECAFHFVMTQALGALCGGRCTPAMISVFAKEMLEQVVLRGQGGTGAFKTVAER